MVNQEYPTYSPIKADINLAVLTLADVAKRRAEIAEANEITPEKVMSGTNVPSP